MDFNAVSIKSLHIYFGINAELFQRQYKQNLSNYSDWSQKSHAQEYLFFPEHKLDEVVELAGDVLNMNLEEEVKVKVKKNSEVIKVIPPTTSDGEIHNNMNKLYIY